MGPSVLPSDMSPQLYLLTWGYWPYILTEDGVMTSQGRTETQVVHGYQDNEGWMRNQGVEEGYRRGGWRRDGGEEG